MYIPKNFEVTDNETLFAFIRANGFGQLVSTVEGRLYSSHIPFLLSSDKDYLICHIAKNNPQWNGIEGQEVLITFQGPHDYISPSWYTSPGVPTWNYQAVHIYGSAELITDVEGLKEIVDAITKRYESSFEHPWSPEYKQALLQAIVGIKVKITEIQGKFKLSQNRSASDRMKITRALESNGATQLAEAMKAEL